MEAGMDAPMQAKSPSVQSTVWEGECPQVLGKKAEKVSWFGWPGLESAQAPEGLLGMKGGRPSDLQGQRNGTEISSPFSRRACPPRRPRRASPPAKWGTPNSRSYFGPVPKCAVPGHRPSLLLRPPEKNLRVRLNAPAWSPRAPVPGRCSAPPGTDSCPDADAPGSSTAGARADPVRCTA